VSAVTSLVAVTGVNGFVGRHLCAMAGRTGCELRAVSRADMEGRGLEHRLRGVDALIHLAAKAHDRPGRADNPGHAFHADNVVLTQQVGDACVAAGVSRMVFVSSAGVLGRCSPASGFTDLSLPAPHDAYTRSKFAAEEMLRNSYSGRLDTVIIRPPLVYGPGAKGSFSRLMRLASRDWPLPFGALTAPRSLISVRNLCHLLLRTATAGDARGLCMLAADAETTSIAELFTLVRATRGRPSRLFGVPHAMLTAGLWLAGRRRDFAGLALPCVLNGAVARDTLGWTPPYRLQAEIEWTVGCAASASEAS